MTRARALSLGDERRLELEGHATGSVAACAAISGLVYALAGFLLNETEPHERRIELSGGKALVSARGGAAVDAAFKMAVIGLLHIAAAEPGGLEVDCEGF